MEFKAGDINRRAVLSAMAGAAIALPLTGAAAPTAAVSSQVVPDGVAWPTKNLEPVPTRHVMDLVVTCSNPVPMGANKESKDGMRGEVWPIIGGFFVGENIRGTVVPGGADFPVVRPDGVVVVDAFYHLKTDDDELIIIHNVGYEYPTKGVSGGERYRLAPTFTANQGKYAWLNRSLFIATLIYGDAVPDNMRVAKGSDQNDRLIQVHQVM